MHKLPVVSYKELLKLLNRLGYSVERQRGSHIRLKKVLNYGHHSITIPAHKEIAKGTLNDILEKVSIRNQISREDLLIRLREI